MNQKIPVPGTREPDLLDELARWIPLIFDVSQLLNGPMSLDPAPPAQPGTDRPRALIAAERIVRLLETSEKLQTIVCRSPARCEHHLCRRRRRCGKLEETAAKLAAARTRLAAERAKWQPPPPAPTEPPPAAVPAEPPRGRRKGRTGVRP